MEMYQSNIKFIMYKVILKESSISLQIATFCWNEHPKSLIFSYQPDDMWR